MKKIFEHIEKIKGQPHHIRRRVAFGAAAVGTAIISFVWLAGSLGKGVFALKATSFADSTRGEGTLVASSDNTSQGLAGAAAAPALENASAPARIQIVDTASSTVSGKKAEQTVIPF